MYLPKHFRTTSNPEILRVIDENPFATVLSYDESKEPFFSHIPLIIDKNSQELILLGHIAKQNAQWRHFRDTPKAKIIIHGPHTYITPKWYKSGRDVPTWNYAAVHLTAKVTLIEDFEGLTELLKTMTAHFESGSESPGQFELPADLANPKVLQMAIVGFQLHIEHIDAKFKLSQNRSLEDKKGVVEGLSERTDDQSLEVKKMMERLCF